MWPSLQVSKSGLSVFCGLLYFSSLANAQNSSLSLASTSALPGAVVSLNLSLNADAGSAPAGLQWKFSYAGGDVLGVVPAAGPALTSAGKTLSCNSTSSTVTCLASGRNATAIGNGVVAVV